MLTTKSLRDVLVPFRSINIAAKTDGTATGTTADLSTASDFNGALVVFQVGTKTDGTHLCTVEESDDDSSWATTTNLNGSIPANVTSNTDIAVAYLGSKRYIRAKVVTSGSTTGAVIGASVIKANPRVATAAS